MKKSALKFLLVNILFLICLLGESQDIQVKSRLESIKINPDTTFSRNVNVTVKKSINGIIFPIFYDSELEEVSDIIVEIKKRKRFKTLDDPVINESDVDIDYITSKKIKSIIIPPEVEARISYRIKCDELMYLCDLRFFSYDEVDTLEYKIKVPDKFRFSYDLIHRDSLEFIDVDSLKAGGSVNWAFKAVPVKVKADPLMYFGIYKNLKMPLMRTIVVPEEYKNKEKEYLAEWYLDKAGNKRGLDSVAVKKIDELTLGLSDPEEIVECLYNYVKSNFKYVGIEIGMGAFIPSPVNEVFRNKQGDCKDLSNYLSEALKYKGVESHVALASTYNHISDCDFPSLSSANHVICVAYVNDKAIILDPTDPVHIPGTPVQSLQERSILIINPESVDYHTIKASNPEQNLVDYEIELKADTERTIMEGNFQTKYEGISGNFLKRAFLSLTDNEINDKGKKHYESVFGKQSVSDVRFKNQKKSVEAKAKLAVNGKIFNDGNNRFLFIDFLPRIIESEERETLLEGTYVGSTIDKKVKLRIIMDESFEMFSPILHNHSDEGVSLDLKISCPTDSIIECEYEFRLEHIFIEKKNIERINQVLESFKKISNDPIILKKKS